MKPKVTKSIHFALILSIGLHIALIFVLKVLYRPEPSSTKNITYLEISQLPPQRSLRTLKRTKYVPPKITPIRQKQIENEVNLPIATLPTAAPISHQNPVTPLRGFSLPASRTLGINKPSLSFAAPAVNQGMGSRPGSTKFNMQGISRVTKHRSFKPPIDDALPGISDLPLPNVILKRIGLHVVASRSTNMVDIVFVIDASGSMKDNINAVRNHLSSMTSLFDNAKIDFTLGVVIFRDDIFSSGFEVIAQTRSVSQIKRALTRVKCRGGEKALDALIRAADEVSYRKNADVHFVLITDEYVSGNYSARDVLNKMNDAKIKVDVIGLNEPFQKFITRSTGGLWLPISSLGVH